MRIAVMGAGGVGAYVGGHLLAAGEDVVLIARGAHLDAMRTRGLAIESPEHPLTLPPISATDTPADIGPVDLVLFTVKRRDTQAAAHMLKPIVTPNTRILTVQNGIGSADDIASALPDAHVIAGVIYIACAIESPGVLHTPGGPRQIIADAADGDATVAAFIEACARTPAIDAAAVDNIDTAVWSKFIALSSIAGSTALLRATAGPILDHPETRAFQHDLVDEAIAVAVASGIEPPADMHEQVMQKYAAFPHSFNTSMAVDRERGRPLELEWLSGTVHRLGLELNIPTPAHTAVYRGLVLYADGAPPAT